MLGKSENVVEVIASIEAVAATAVARLDMARSLVDGGMPAAVLGTCLRTLPNAVRSGTAKALTDAFAACTQAVGSPLVVSCQLFDCEQTLRMLHEIETSISAGVAGGKTDAAAEKPKPLRRKGSRGGGTRARKESDDVEGAAELPLTVPQPPPFVLALSAAREDVLVSIADALVRAARSVGPDDADAAVALHKLVSACCSSGFFSCAVTAASAVATGTTAAAPLAGKLAEACEALARSSPFALDSLHAMGLPAALARAMAHPALQEGALADSWCAMTRAFLQLHAEIGSSASVDAAMKSHASEDKDNDGAAASATALLSSAHGAADAPASAFSSPVSATRYPISLPYPLPAEAVRLPDIAAYHLLAWNGGGRRMLALSLVLLRLLARSGDERTRQAAARVSRRCRAPRYVDAAGQEQDGRLLVAADSPLRVFRSLRPMINDTVAALLSVAVEQPAAATGSPAPASFAATAGPTTAAAKIRGAQASAKRRSKSSAAVAAGVAKTAAPRTGKARPAAAAFPTAGGERAATAGTVATGVSAVGPSPAAARPASASSGKKAPLADSAHNTGASTAPHKSAVLPATAKSPKTDKAKAQQVAKEKEKKDQPRRYGKGQSKRARGRGAGVPRVKLAAVSTSTSATPRLGAATEASTRRNRPSGNATTAK